MNKINLSGTTKRLEEALHLEWKKNLKMKLKTSTNFKIPTKDISKKRRGKDL